MRTNHLIGILFTLGLLASACSGGGGPTRQAALVTQPTPTSLSVDTLTPPKAVATEPPVGPATATTAPAGGGGETLTPTSTSQAPSDTPVPTDTPTPTPPPTATFTPVPAFDFKEIAYIPGGGGGPGPFGEIICPGAENAFNLAELPAIEHTSAPRILFCLYGFPEDRDVSVEFYLPSGKRAAVQTAQVTEEINGVSIAYLDLTEIATLPQGNWHVIARSGDLQAETDFQYGDWKEQVLFINHKVAKARDPWDVRWNAPYIPGDVLQVNGYGYESDRDIPVGVYFNTQQFSEETGAYLHQPVAGTVARSDGQGHFSAEFKVDASWPQGDYKIIPITDPNQTVFELAEWDVFFQVYQAYKACPSGPPSYIPNDFSYQWFAYVVEGSPNNVRFRPALGARKLGELPPLSVVEVLDGPRCNDNLTWWRVRTEDGKLEGWTAEGDSKGPWLRLR